MIKDITSLFKKTDSRIVASAIKNGSRVLALVVNDFNGILVSNRKLGNQIQKELDEKTGVLGFISSDELPQYGLNESAKEKILNACKASPKDVVVMVADQKPKAEQALNIIQTHITAFKKNSKKSTIKKIFKPKKRNPKTIKPKKLKSKNSKKRA